MDDLNGLDARIDTRAFFERILNEREKLELVRMARLEDRFTAIDKALVLQADEYSRRLKDLNGEYQRDRTRQSQYVTIDKWETVNETEKVARETALLRVNERFDSGIEHVNAQFQDYIKRYELERREVDLRLAAQAGAAEEAKRAVEEAVRKSDAQSRELARRQSRNLGLASLGLGLIVFFANVVPLFVK